MCLSCDHSGSRSLHLLGERGVREGRHPRRAFIAYVTLTIADPLPRPGFLRSHLTS